MKIEHILLTTDLSEEALRPCAWVTVIARTFDARVTLLHVVEDLAAIQHGAPFAPALSAPDLEGRMDQALIRVAEQRESLRGDVPVETDVVSGVDVAVTTAEYARRNSVDLIAISTHGRTGFRHLVVGSVAEAVLRHSPVPVLVFPRPGT
jgi:nucleotide-binding universal stress UspA family protein